jgi:hypothetical protein
MYPQLTRRANKSLGACFPERLDSSRFLMSALVQPCVRPYPLPSFVDDYAGLVAATFSRRFEDPGESSINGLSGYPNYFPAQNRTQK